MKNTERDGYNELTSLLPITITRIQIQKNNKDRFSLYHEDRFLLGIKSQTLVFCSLKKGTLLTNELLETILNTEQYNKAKEYCLNLLSRRDHSVKELILKGIKKGYNKEILERITLELQKNKYLDDHRFASNLIHDAIKLRTWSLNKIKFELQKKGVIKSITNELLSDLDHSIWKEQLFTLIGRNKANLKRTDPNKRKKKIYDYLTRKGYTPTLIWSEMNNLLLLIENDKKS